jgi:hypothetical protein
MTQPARRPVDRAARESAKRVLRRYGELTSALRHGPDFVIIGAKRGGSTSLYRYVLEHPSIQPLSPAASTLRACTTTTRATPAA